MQLNDVHGLLLNFKDSEFHLHRCCWVFRPCYIGLGFIGIKQGLMHALSHLKNCLLNYRMT